MIYHMSVAPDSQDGEIEGHEVSTSRRNFPTSVRGMESIGITCFGRLNGARLPRTASEIWCGVTPEVTTKAVTASPHLLEGTPMTAASTTPARTSSEAGWLGGPG